VVFVGSDDRISHVLKGKEAKLANLGKEGKMIGGGNLLCDKVIQVEKTEEGIKKSL